MKRAVSLLNRVVYAVSARPLGVLAKSSACSADGTLLGFAGRGMVLGSWDCGDSEVSKRAS